MKKSTANGLPVPKELVIGVAAVLGLAYLQVTLRSKEKWFHLLLMAVVAFGGIQFYSFLESQQHLDAQIEKYRKRTLNINLSRESSLSSGERATQGSAQEESAQPKQEGAALEELAAVKTPSEERRPSADRSVEPDPGKHQEELTERLEQISNTLKEHVS